MAATPARFIALPLLANVVSKLENEHCCVSHCWGVYEQNSIVRVVDWTTEKAIIASNESFYFHTEALS